MSSGKDVRLAFEAAEARARAGQWQEVEVALAGARERLHELPRAVLLLAEAHCRLHDVGPGRDYAMRALQLLAAKGDAQGAMKACNLLGIVHFEMGELDAALSHFLAALELGYQLEEHVVCARINNNLGSLCNLREEHEAASEHFAEALALYERAGDTLGQSQTLHNLGITYRDLERFEQADAAFARAARASQAAGDQRLFGLAVVARGELMLRKGDLAAAERMARGALLRFDVHSSLFGLAEAHKLLGTVARLQGDATRARTHLDKALEICGLHAGPLLEAETRLERGILRLEAGEPDAATEDLAAAADIFARLGAVAQATRARALLAETTAGSTTGAP